MEKKKVLITGTSCGVGRSAAIKFLNQGYQVYGLDRKKSTIEDKNYFHTICDVGFSNQLPDIDNVEIIVNNAGIVTPKAEAIRTNLIGYINVIEKYSNSPVLKSIVNIGSTASIKGYDNLYYCASQGGRDSITKWAANNLGHDKRHVIVNSINLDGIVPADPELGVAGTSLEPALYEDKETMKKIAELSVLKRLATVEEIAEWIYFITVVNTVVTGEIIHIDGELIGAYKFMKYPGWDD